MFFKKPYKWPSWYADVFHKGHFRADVLFIDKITFGVRAVRT